MARIIATTDDYLAHVTWRNNCDPQTLKEAVADAKRGFDGGYEKTMALRPSTKFFEDWMDCNNLTTFLVNRDTGVRTLLSALRKTIHVKYQSCALSIYCKIVL